MASYVRKKEALRAAVLAFLAGAHCVTEEVERMQGVIYSGLASDSEETREARQNMLVENLETFLNSNDTPKLFASVLNDEALYPFGDEWSSDALSALIEKVKIPTLTFGLGSLPLYDPRKSETFVDSDGEQFSIDPEDIDPDVLRFRFRKGFKKYLQDYAEEQEGVKSKPDSVDHWMIQLINTAFHSGMNIAAQIAENGQRYYESIDELQNQEELWTRYPQLEEIFERQLRRETKRKTGLVTDYDIE